MQLSSKHVIYFFHAFAAAAWLSTLVPQAGFCSAARASFTRVPAHNRAAVVERAYNVDFDDDERRVRMLAAASQKLLGRQWPGSPASCVIRGDNLAYRKLFSFDVVLLI
jgi:hypothetical protein